MNNSNYWDVIALILMGILCALMYCDGYRDAVEHDSSCLGKKL